ncbi:MAG: trypsin-like serine protease [Nostoc sp. EfeVER01]|uniref:trypsin-like serine protease n=1 Tax=unclassified Nostoc TaxID=2593658 RepID=UPI002AD45D53|nr:MULTISPECIES: trypsin-like serine protease [unclassified Nostoc]MDZ7945240.1 trypsin-like serine protease [Nostoc sp. EfeVER01]MDZ7991529.1 trypsin-like serine protease [Nostoc sp. EspVER01]
MSIFSPDGRTKVSNTTTFPFSAIGKMRIRWKGPDGVIDTADDIIINGSGAMISPYHFLTAGHSVYDTRYGGWADKIEVMLGSKGNIIAGTNRADYEYYGEAKSVHTRSFEGWIQGDQTKSETFQYDIGLVTLDRNIGNFTGWFNYGYDDNLTSGTLMNVTGYPSDKFDSNIDGKFDNYDMWTQSGKITSTTDSILRSNELDISPGNSGGPLWLNNSNTNKPTIYGVASNETTSNQTPLYNEFARITSTRYNEIQTWINEDTTTRKPTDKADLVDSDVWFNTTLGSFSNNTIKNGENFSITVYPRNNGTAATGNLSVSFYASTDTNITNSIGSHYLIGNTTISSINPFNSGTATWNGAFPNIPIGNYYVISFLDPTNSIQEFDESLTSNQKVFRTLLTVANSAISPLTISSTLSSSLTAREENITTGTANINETGNNQLNGGNSNDILIGGSGNDTFVGALGNDTLTGGTGSDVFIINTPAEGIDNITDFSSLDDTIYVSKIGFGGGLSEGILQATQFFIGSVAQNSSDRFIYDNNTGGLFFDADGTGLSGQIEVAQLGMGLAMTNANIFVIA